MTLINNPLSHVVIQLMKGVIYQDKQAELWNILLNIQASVREYVAVMGLELLIDELEGYAFLRQCNFTEEDETSSELPRLVQRRQLNYSVSLLCVLLRKKLIENDTAGASTRVILTHQEILDMMSVFLPGRANEVKTGDQINACINKIVDYGFLRELKNDAKCYEIQRIMKAFVDADWLNNIENKLREYSEYGQSIAE